MQIIGIIGPFRAPTSWQIEQHIRRAEALALEVWKLGAACICPHTNTRFFQGEAPDAVWLAGYLAILARVDAVLLVPGWEASSGSRAEVAFARQRMLPVFTTLAALQAWLERPVILPEMPSVPPGQASAAIADAARWQRERRFIEDLGGGYPDPKRPRATNVALEQIAAAEAARSQFAEHEARRGIPGPTDEEP